MHDVGNNIEWWHATLPEGDAIRMDGDVMMQERLNTSTAWKVEDVG